MSIDITIKTGLLMALKKRREREPNYRHQSLADEIGWSNSKVQRYVSPQSDQRVVVADLIVIAKALDYDLGPIFGKDHKSAVHAEVCRQHAQYSEETLQVILDIQPRTYC